MDEVEQLVREYYAAYIAHRMGKHAEDPIALIHAIMASKTEYEGDSFEDTDIEKSIREDWKDPGRRAAMEAEYEEYRDEQTRKNERQRRGPSALWHAINEATNDPDALERNTARAIEVTIRYEWRDNPGRRAEMERNYEEAQYKKARV
jgi:hypothetical protein